jgi:hypothetical protein
MDGRRIDAMQYRKPQLDSIGAASALIQLKITPATDRNTSPTSHDVMAACFEAGN